MPDMKKVISCLHCKAKDLMIDLPACDECNYQIQLDNRRECDFRQLCRDAAALLEEHQPKEPMQLKYSETREEYWFYESICPKCGNHWISNGTDHFCPACGQPVFEPCEEEQKDGDHGGY